MLAFLRRGITSMLIGLYCFGSISNAQNNAPDDHKVFFSFGAWKDVHDEGQKTYLYLGFVNGLFAGERSQKYDALARCIEKNISRDQAFAMIEKYSTDNPQRWNVPLPMGIVEALTVKDGPCPGLDPF